MADEKSAEATESPEPQAEETPASEPKETQATGTEEPKEAVQDQPKENQEPTTPEPPRRYKLKIDGQEEEHDEGELIELAQKGASFTKKQQAMAEWERANQEKLHMADQMMNNPVVWRMAMAQRMGLDPSIVLNNPAAPNPNLEGVDPAAYYTQAAEYRLAIQQKQAVEQALGQYAVQMAQTNNAAILAKARTQHDLSDQQVNEIAQFVYGKMRPNGIGQYSDADIQYAVAALYGKERQAKAVLQTADNIREKIKAGTSTAPARATKEKFENVAPEVADSA